MSERHMTNGVTGEYVGSHEDCHGPMRVLGVHKALNGDGSDRFIIAILDDRGGVIQTLSNVRRESLV